jgi:hypothetical protein
MYRIKNKIRQIRKLIRWIPIIWRDRDWDYYFTYEILKQKLIDTEKYIRRDGVHFYNNRDADDILKAIDMIEKVQNEYHLDKYLTSWDWDSKDMHQAVDDHDKARQELFQHLSDNIETWWD